MVAQIIDGRAIAAILNAKTAEKVHARQLEGKRSPNLAVILVGEDQASHIYVRNKRQACESIGIGSIYHHLPNSLTQQELVNLIQALNNDENIDGILLQLPLPNHLDTDSILECIHPSKDVDGFHAYNLGRLAQRRPLLRPCTPYGIMLLLDHIHQIYKGKHAVMIGASNLVGRPMALELLIAGATVTICHRFTVDLPFYVKQADILISAVGKPGIIKGEWIKENSTVIDVGITRLKDGTITGDIQFDLAKQKAAWITPVPGGVGPMTVAVLLHNTLIAANLAPI